MVGTGEGAVARGGVKWLNLWLPCLHFGGFEERLLNCVARDCATTQGAVHTSLECPHYLKRHENISARICHKFHLTIHVDLMKKVSANQVIRVARIYKVIDHSIVTIIVDVLQTLSLPLMAPP